jgi:hypothetical protein
VILSTSMVRPIVQAVVGRRSMPSLRISKALIAKYASTPASGLKFQNDAARKEERLCVSISSRLRLRQKAAKS